MDRALSHRWISRGARFVSRYRLSVLLGAFGTIAVLFLWQQALERENLLLEELVEQQARAIEGELSRELTAHVAALERMADRWTVRGGTDRQLWESDANNYLRDFPDYEAIEWVDPSFVPRWIVPPSANETLPPDGKNERRIAARKARALHGTVLSDSVSLASGGRGFVVSVPLFTGDRGGTSRFDGWIVGIFRFDRLFANIGGLPEGYRVQILDRSRPIYGESPPESSRFTRTISIEAYGAGWSARVFPSPGLVSRSRAVVPVLIFWGGTLCVWTLALSSGLGQRARERSRQLRESNRQLQDEIALRGQLELFLREKEERWQLALQGNKDGIWDWNIRNDAIAYSSRCLEMLGYAGDEHGISAEERLALLHPDDREAVTRAVEDHLARKTPFYLSEHRVRCKDGTYKWILDRGQAVWDESGEPIRMSGSHTDITERKQAEQRQEDLILALEKSIARLSQSEARFHAFMNNSPMAAWITDTSGNVVYANRTYSRTLAPATPDRVAESERKSYPPAVERQRSAEKIREIRRTDGSIGEFAVYQFPIPDATGRVWIGAIALDITERQRSETAIARLAAIVESSEDAIIGKTLDGIVTSWNAGAERIFGYRSGEILGRSIALLFPDDDRDEETEILRKIGRGESIEHYQTVRQRKDGARIQVSVGISPVRDRSGTIIGISTIVRDISDRYRMAQALQRSESRFQQIVSASPSLIYTAVRDPDGTVHYTYLSPAFEDIFEVPIEVGLNGPSLRFIHPDDRDTYLEAVARSAELDRLFHHQWRIVTPSGKVKWIEASSRPERRENGEFAWYGVLQDITDHKQTEQQLELQAIITRNMAEGICLFRADDQILVYTNPKFDRMFGYAAGELLGRHISTIDHPTDTPSAEDIDRAILTLLATGESSFETRNVRKDGSILWCHATAARFNHPDHGEVFVVVHQDITARKQAEEALQQRVRQESALLSIAGAIRQSLDFEEILTTTVTAVRQTLEVDRAVVYRFHPDWSGDFLLESVGPDWTPLVGLADTWEDTYLQETGGGRFRDRETYAIDDIYSMGLHSCHLELLERFQARAYAVAPIFSGNVLWGLLAIYQNSRPRAWQAWEIELLQQITDRLAIAIQQSELYRRVQIELGERQSAEREARRAMRSAEAANAAKSAFLANMSHELRTPLNIILGFARVMANDPGLPAEHREHVEIVQRSGDHLLGLINDILDLSKIEAGRYTIEERAFDLLGSIDNLRSLLSEWVHSKDLRLSIEISPAVPRWIVSDRQRLHQVLLNLLGNAIKFTERGGINLRVTPVDSPVSPDDNELTLQFEIADTGIGIAPAELEAIFDAFIQARSEERSIGGTGLGLTISRKILHLMGGEISARSVPGEGSTFVVTLPVRRALELVSVSGSIGPRAIEIVPGQPIRRLLIVDDRSDNRLLLRRFLSEPGLEIREAENGIEAVEIWREWRPHLIWMDIRMPLLDGYAATERIRALESDETTIIIALTAQASEDDRERSLAAGCNDYISKPFQEEILFRKMKEYLGLEYRLVGTGGERSIPALAEKKSPAELRQTLQNLPIEWLEELENSAACGNDTSILQLVDRVSPEYPELAAHLADLATQFQFERILDLLST
ncbi:PAS domain S-box protein [Pannus brasiliensis CCIBt3594]|uniref:Circadian input-output histidine kinase CikA n=1 Tax=Pannus brasiliensis CCIBt3594 TaxID=1427578 RepID=A0AAW9QI95_9CHRO